MQGLRRDRSRSPYGVEIFGRRRENQVQETNKNVEVPNANLVNQMMMYQQGNIMMAGGMYPNMMMPGAMIGGGMIPAAGMEMMPGTGMELMAQPSMDMSAIRGQAMANTNAATVDLSMMGGMMMDTSVMGMYPGMPAEMPTIPEKKEIVLKHCKLIPPDPGKPQPVCRSKPAGCRTIFVGGLPDKIRENTVREIFENYGRIHTMRLSKKNFCHIRYEREDSATAAMEISGYKIKLTYRDDKEEDDDSYATTGWLQVDYALSRDDQNEYERRQRQAMRAQQVQMEQLKSHQEIATRSLVYKRSPSPVRIQPFSNAAIVQLNEKIKSEEFFAGTLPTLLAWLERGECSKKNSNQFYSMIQTTNSHIRRLFGEKMQAEDELQECKDRVRKTIEQVIEQLEQVAKVFTAATHQRVWDHFTKPQRKNIETWQKMSQEFIAMKEEFNEKFYNEDIDFSSYNHKADQQSEELQKLKRENESLLFQIEAYKNELEVVKGDTQKEMEKFKAQFIARRALQDALQNHQPPLPSTPAAKPPPPPPTPDDLNTKVNLKESVDAGCGEAQLIGVMSAFLQVHPKGASLDYVVSYVRALSPNASQATIHHVLQKHPDVFRRSTTGVGANIEHRWFFIALLGDQKSS